MILYPHQEQALDATKNIDHVAYYMDMGLGKTYVGSVKMEQIGNGRNVLVCQKSKVRDWIEHFKENHRRYALYDMTKVNFWKNDGLTDAEAGLDYGVPYVLFINYELAWRRPDLNRLCNFTLVLDESSLIQNEKAKQSKFIVNKLSPSSVILLSGTPTSGKYENLWTQGKLLGWNISKKLYQSQYVNWKTQWVGGTPIYVIDKENPYKNVERLKEKLREHGAYFVKTEDVLEMPSQNFSTIKVPTNLEYRRFMKNGVVTLKDGTELVGDTTLTKRLRARQLCGIYNDSKFEAFMDLLNSTKDRLIVFYSFNAELQRLRELTGERHISVLNGPTKDLWAYENEDNSVTFVQYQAGAMGVNLQKANKMVYFSLPERSELFEQSKKRIHRIGQDKPCFYYVLECENSVEEAIHKALDRKRDFTDELFKEEVETQWKI